MQSHETNTNPNQHVNLSHEQVDLLSVTNIEALRAHQLQQYQNRVEQGPIPDRKAKQDDFIASIDQVTDEYLESLGVDDEQARAQLLHELNQFSIVNMNEQEWLVGSSNRHHNRSEPSGIDRARAQYQQRIDQLATDPATVNLDPATANLDPATVNLDPPTIDHRVDTDPTSNIPYDTAERIARIDAIRKQPEYAEAVLDLDDKRNLLARAAARRATSVLGSKKREEAYNKAREAYDKAYIEFMKKQHQIDIITSPGRVEGSDDDRRLLAESFLKNEKALYATISEHMEDTPMGKLIKALNSDNKLVKYGTRYGAAAALGVIGAVVTTATGGGALVAAGLAGVGATSRLVRNYGMAQKQGRTLELDTDAIQEEMRYSSLGADSVDDLYGRYAESAKDGMEREMLGQNVKRRKALGKAAVITVVGTVAGSAGAHLWEMYGSDVIDGAKHLGGNLVDGVRHLFGGTDVAGAPHAAPELPDTGSGHNTVPHGGTGAETGAHAGVDTPSAPDHGGAGAGGSGIEPASPSSELFNHLNISRGEGWYQFLQDNGLSHQQAVDVLKAAGPELQQHGLAYFDHLHGNYGMLYNNGKMPQAALDILGHYMNK